MHFKQGITKQGKTISNNFAIAIAITENCRAFPVVRQMQSQKVDKNSYTSHKSFFAKTKLELCEKSVEGIKYLIPKVNSIILTKSFGG